MRISDFLGNPGLVACLVFAANGLKRIISDCWIINVELVTDIYKIPIKHLQLVFDGYFLV